MWLLPDDAPFQARAELRRYLGVDKPLHEQYAIYLRDALRGDFGNSFFEHRPVTEVFAERVPMTLQLTALSLLLAAAIGVPIGIYAAAHRNSPTDRLVMSLSFTAYAVPNFLQGILLILVFSLILRWLPSGGYGGINHYIMPVFTLGASSAALLARLTRSAMLDVLGEDYVRTAYAKGLSGSTVIIKHALRNAFIPVLTIIGLEIATLISGSVVVETVFAWPGAGRLIVGAVTQRDFPVLQLAVLVVAVSVVVVNTLIDVAYALLDPRIRMED